MHARIPSRGVEQSSPVSGCVSVPFRTGRITPDSRRSRAGYINETFRLRPWDELPRYVVFVSNQAPGMEKPLPVRPSAIPGRVAR